MLSKKELFSLLRKVSVEYKNGVVYPPKKQIFRAFTYDKIKIVILGQDPYHEKNQANGLAFSVNDRVKIPPSLRNIFKELNISPKNGDLTKWAEQGVLLLNTALTVREGQADSHKKLWEKFTVSVIEELNEYETPLVFMLWGNNAKSYEKYITDKKHLILTAAHPSPLSASRGFFGCNHFSVANEFLKKNNLEIINWDIDNE
jgi:uracil-DNA glycosylase